MKVLKKNVYFFFKFKFLDKQNFSMNIQKPFKNLSFLSNDSNSLNQSSLKSERNESRRNTIESIPENEYANFFNEWNNLHFNNKNQEKNENFLQFETLNMNEGKKMDNFEINLNCVKNIKFSILLFYLRLNKIKELLL